MQSSSELTPAGVAASLRSKALTDEGIEALVRRGGLRHLAMSDCGLLTDGAVDNVVRLLPGLQSLEFATYSHGGYATSRVGLLSGCCYVPV